MPRRIRDETRRLEAPVTSLCWVGMSATRTKFDDRHRGALSWSEWYVKSSKGLYLENNLLKNAQPIVNCSKSASAMWSQRRRLTVSRKALSGTDWRRCIQLAGGPTRTLFCIVQTAQDKRNDQRLVHRKTWSGSSGISNGAVETFKEGLSSPFTR